MLLGIVQALTEFLPVSSSGHLVIAKSLLKIGEAGITFEIFTHLATTLAVIVYLRKKIWALIRGLVGYLGRAGGVPTESDRAQARLAGLILLGSVPAALLGLTLNDFFEGLFGNLTAVGVMLVVTGLFLMATGRKAREDKPLGAPRALAVGLAQAAAIIPGLSRSGLTVGAGLAVGIPKREAFEFSLLLSIPAVLGATLFKILDGGLAGDPLVVAASAAAALVGGYIAIAALFRVVVKNRFYAFAYYLIPVGLLVTVLSRLG
ncbi:MAG: undecaprenyl-diphosphate phosphatase [bacterium]